MRAVVLAEGGILVVVEVLIAKEVGGRVALETIDEALEALGGYAITEVGLSHAVGTPLGEGVVFEFDTVESAQFDVTARSHGHGNWGRASWPTPTAAMYLVRWRDSSRVRAGRPGPGPYDGSERNDDIAGIIQCGRISATRGRISSRGLCRSTGGRLRERKLAKLIRVGATKTGRVGGRIHEAHVSCKMRAKVWGLGVRVTVCALLSRRRTGQEQQDDKESAPNCRIIQGGNAMISKGPWVGSQGEETWYLGYAQLDNECQSLIITPVLLSLLACGLI